jgi:hypothetical protein
VCAFLGRRQSNGSKYRATDPSLRRSDRVYRKVPGRNGYVQGDGWAFNWHQHLMQPVANWQSVWHAADFRYDQQADPKGGERYLSYFPFVEPWAFLVFTIFLLLLSVFCFSSLFPMAAPETGRRLQGAEGSRCWHLPVGIQGAGCCRRCGGPAVYGSAAGWHTLETGARYSFAKFPSQRFHTAAPRDRWSGRPLKRGCPQSPATGL